MFSGGRFTRVVKNQNSFSRCIVFLLLLFLISSPLQAQIFDKVWKAPTMGIEMVLNSNGTYQFTGPGGNSSGQFVLNGNILQMQDNRSGLVTIYRVALSQEGNLILMDAYGGILQLTPEERKESPVLARAGGLILSEDDVAVGYNLVAIIIAEPLNTAEKERLRKKAIEEFKQNPQAFLQQVNNLRPTLQKLRQIKDPFKAGLTRQMLFAELYFASKSLPEAQKPEIIRIINEHVHVIAEDLENRLLITDRDVEAFVEYEAFVTQITGSKDNTANHSLADFMAALRKNFAALPLQTKQGIAAVYPIWQSIQKVWAKMTETQKRQAIANYRNALKANLSTSAPNYYKPILTDPRAMRQASPQEIYQRSMDSMRNSVMTGWMRQNTFLNTLNAQVGYGTSFWPSPFSN